MCSFKLRHGLLSINSLKQHITELEACWMIKSQLVMTLFYTNIVLLTLLLHVYIVCWIWQLEVSCLRAFFFPRCCQLAETKQAEGRPRLFLVLVRCVRALRHRCNGYAALSSVLMQC